MYVNRPLSVQVCRSYIFQVFKVTMCKFQTMYEDLTYYPGGIRAKCSQSEVAAMHRPFRIVGRDRAQENAQGETGEACRQAVQRQRPLEGDPHRVVRGKGSGKFL
jgi:hypothetical protein